MFNKTWYDSFVGILTKRYPKNAQLTQALMDLLSLEREAVYRRLRQDVKFSIQEVVKIATTWNISIDELIGLHSEKVPFMMRPMNYLEPSKQEFYFIQHLIQTIKHLNNFPDSEVMDICNKLPCSLYTGFPYLNRFYLFKWMYQYGNKEEAVPFSKIVVSGKELQLTTDYYQALKQVPNTIFIFDYLIFEYLINDIRYFYFTLLITLEEKELIKKDLHNLLNYLSEVAGKGYYPETRNKVTIYISQLNINTNYRYVHSDESDICFVHVFDKFKVHTYEQGMVESIKTWMQLKKRTSIQISGVDEKSRIEFFMKQRQLVDNL